MKLLNFQNLALMVSCIVVLLTILRVIYFCNFSTTTTLEVLSVINRVNVLTSTAARLMFILGYPAGIISVVLFRGSTRKVLGISMTRALIMAMMVLAPLAISILPMVPAALGALVVAVYAVWIRLHHTPESLALAIQARRSRKMGTWQSTFWAGLVIYGLLASPWQPLEVLSFTRAPGHMTAYVMGEQGGRLLVLNDSHDPLWIKSDDVASRELCSNDLIPWWVKSLSDAIEARNRGNNCAFSHGTTR